MPDSRRLDRKLFGRMLDRHPPDIQAASLFETCQPTPLEKVAVYMDGV